MWPKAESDLAALLTSKVFPLLRGLPEYEALLAGGKPDPVKCQVAAKQIVKTVQTSGGVHGFGSRQVVAATEWTDDLYRAASPRNNPCGAWWFDAELIRRWEQVYPASLPRLERREKIFNALRPMLAVCYDWNDFTQLWVMKPGGLGLPVLTGQGTSQPIFSKSAGQNHLDNRNVLFIGGYQQVYVPFVQKARVVQYLI
ncbi:MAG TPA: hypothetical protein VNU92_15005 [Edaphobacter sp.]|jgi:hypothetical protein|nr:hypothetical protein [Edaphobacter sp.]